MKGATKSGEGMRARRACGFTLAETAATVAVIGVVAAVALPFYSGFLKDTHLDNAAEEVESAFIYARTTAIRTGLPCRITFDVETDSMIVERIVPDPAVLDTNRTYLTRAEAQTRFYTPAEHPLRPDRSYRVPFPSVPRFGGAEIAGADFDGADTVAFDPFGNASATGFVRVALGGDTVVVGLLEWGGEIKELEKIIAKD
ncbi:MAG: hypothetical protein JW958_10540 [Candidatus Eisenbacteria bacterium]|nr:hypothetical protein [Candidatus Eisenbacteria bacterium]